MAGIILKGTMHEICTKLQADLNDFGNMPISEYQVVCDEITKYGKMAVGYHQQQAFYARAERLNEAVAKQFGMPVEEFKRICDFGGK